MYEGQDDRRRRIAPALHQHTTEEIQLVGRDLEFVLLIEHIVEEGVSRAGAPTAGLHAGDHAAVEVVHGATDVGAAGAPVAEEALGEVFEEGENVDRGCGAGFHDFRPFFEQFVESGEMGCFDGGGADAEDYSFIIPISP